jgi:predicted AlkP superfamily phosphohydrolase/phosphomutase
MQRAEWDVFMVHFQATDVLQHALWSHLDPRHVDYARIPAAERDRVQQFYRRLDENLARVLAAVDARTDVVVMSDHGFGSAVKRIYINQWLANEKYMALTTSPGTLKALGVLEDVVRRLDVLKVRRRIKPAFGQRDQMLRGLTQDRFIDWTQSQVFGFSGTHFANVYVNHQGRFAHGMVLPEEADRLCAEIAAKLLLWTEPGTGVRLIEQVYRREDVYHGPQVEWLPDLIVRPRDGYIFETRFKRGWLTGPLPADLTGVHRMDGILISAGPRFRALTPLGTATLIDMPPTLLYLLDTPVPHEMDGRILTEFLQPEYVAQHPAGKSDAPVVLPLTTDESPYTQEEEQTILDHLARLGYV